MTEAAKRILETIREVNEEQKRSRDAKTGQYVTKGYAKKHPGTTVSETDKPNKKV